MSHRSVSLRLVVIAIVLLGALPAAGQGQADTWTPPRLGDGRPDLQGVWDFRTATPFERPERFGERETLTEEEAAGNPMPRTASRSSSVARAGSAAF